ncbi:hypothetical protein [Streptomyces sp. NBC_01361]|uniref:hypothetical protein n=1 Tax=Streptomyces sp. NBC_01361 TaxID=2903838 RepID=UPI002E330059|nr:hypothetical protein [Streptomyces sp. NBC_01361]
MKSLPNTPATPTSESVPSAGGLLLAARRIQSARARGMTPSDGGGTGRSDGND